MSSSSGDNSYQYRNQIYSSDDNSDELDNFLAGIRTNKKGEKFRLSNGSLDDFIANDDSEDYNDSDNAEIFSSKSKGLKDVDNLGKSLNELSLNKTSVANTSLSKATPLKAIVFSSSSESEDGMQVNKKADSQNLQDITNDSHHGKNVIVSKLCDHSNTSSLSKPDGMSSTCESFPSLSKQELSYSCNDNGVAYDSNDVLTGIPSQSTTTSLEVTRTKGKSEEYWSPAHESLIDKRYKLTSLHDSPLNNDVFVESSDSDENFNKTPKILRNKSDIVVIATDDSEEESCTPRMPVTFKTPSTASAHRSSVLFSSSEEEEKENYVPLASRLIKPGNGINSQKVPVAKHKTSSIPNTPKIVKPAALKEFHTEKIQRTGFVSRPNICSVQNCFLADLDNFPTFKRKTFKNDKFELTKNLFTLFNKSVFNDQLPQSMEIIWKKRLLKTAGQTHCKRRTTTYTKSDGSNITSVQYEASISLSEKVIDCPSRLRDTLIHEMCHAAVWILDNQNEGHGPFWKFWAGKAKSTHPELPIIKRCHSYDIDYKFYYKCNRCETRIGRHSKSIDTSKKVCGKCRGRLVLESNGKIGASPLNPFASYVKENYKTTKTQLLNKEKHVTHARVMQTLSEQFKCTKIT